MRLPIEKLTLKQLRYLFQKLGKNPKGMNRRQLETTINAMIGQ